MIKNITYLGAFTLFVTIIWLAVSVYSSFNSTTISGDIKKQINPLEKSFNTDTLHGLRKRQKVSVNLSETIPERSIPLQENKISQINSESTTSSAVIVLPTPATQSGSLSVEN